MFAVVKCNPCPALQLNEQLYGDTQFLFPMYSRQLKFPTFRNIVIHITLR